MTMTTKIRMMKNWLRELRPYPKVTRSRSFNTLTGEESKVGQPWSPLKSHAAPPAEAIAAMERLRTGPTLPKGNDLFLAMGLLENPRGVQGLVRRVRQWWKREAKGE